MVAPGGGRHAWLLPGGACVVAPRGGMHGCSRGCAWFYRVPTWTGKTGKPGKMGRHFPVREKSGNFEQTGKVRENHTKYWKTEEISEKFICYFSMIFK